MVKVKNISFIISVYPKGRGSTKGSRPVQGAHLTHIYT